ncbi:hypothetical protein L3Q82_016428 [Scortum barcoo]|uniref:Uncharacterized protein n=1 Tax=Scortum barcoo TaxID=214431 RepID=A0ACB8X8H0_9TELE|nr:hypothetical protein L3Q82_016428 [Scortum barcoo]
MRSALSTSKSLDVVGLSWLTRLCNIAWRLGTVPLEWQTGVVVPLLKRGTGECVPTYRGITLLSLPGKVYARVLERRIGRPIVEPLGFRRNNAVFVPGRGTLDQLYTLRRVLRGFMGVCPTSPHVLCGSGEGIRPCPSWYSVGSAPRVWGPGAFAKGCSVSVRPEQELGSHCRHQDLQHGGVPSPGEWRGPASSGGVQVSRGLVHEVRERWSVRLTGGLVQRPAVMRSVYRTAVVKKELSRKAKLSIYRVNLRSHPHLWSSRTLGNDRKDKIAWIQAAEMSFLRRVAGRSSEIGVKLGHSGGALRRAACSFASTRGVS